MADKGVELTHQIHDTNPSVEDVRLLNNTINYDYLAIQEYGNTGLNRFGTFVQEEFISNLRWPQAAKVYTEMSMNDPTIGAVMYMIKQLVRRAKWTVEPASDSPADREVAQFVQECMDDMSMSWADTISEILSMFVYGWSFHEIIYKYRRGPKQKDPRYRSKYDDGRIGWRKMPIRSQSSLFGWVFDPEDGGIIAMEQQSAPDYRVRTIPLSKGLLFRTEVSRDNPEGKSLLRNAYRPWYFKKRIEEIEGIGIERDLAGLPVLIPKEGVDIWDDQNPQSTQLRSRAEYLVKNIRRDTQEGVVIPPGWELKLLSTGGSRQFDTNAIINRYDQRIAIVLLADIVMLGADKVGSFALANVKKSLLAASIEAQTTNICEVFNKYAIRPLCDMNYFSGATDYPKLKCSEIEIPDLNELGDFFQKTGLTIDGDPELEAYLREVASMPEGAAGKAVRESLKNGVPIDLTQFKKPDEPTSSDDPKVEEEVKNDESGSPKDN